MIFKKIRQNVNKLSRIFRLFEFLRKWNDLLNKYLFNFSYGVTNGCHSFDSSFLINVTLSTLDIFNLSIAIGRKEDKYNKDKNKPLNHFVFCHGPKLVFLVLSSNVLRTLILIRNLWQQRNKKGEKHQFSISNNEFISIISNSLEITILEFSAERIFLPHLESSPAKTHCFFLVEESRCSESTF